MSSYNSNNQTHQELLHILRSTPYTCICIIDKITLEICNNLNFLSNEPHCKYEISLKGYDLALANSKLLSDRYQSPSDMMPNRRWCRAVLNLGSSTVSIFIHAFLLKKVHSCNSGMLFSICLGIFLPYTFCMLVFGDMCYLWWMWITS